MQRKVQTAMVRFINQRSLSRLTTLNEGRQEERSDLNVGLWLVPVLDRTPDFDQVIPALTKDVTASGVGFYVNRKIPSNDVLVYLPCDSQVTVLKATVQNQLHLGAGFYLVGVHLEEVVQNDGGLSHEAIETQERQAMMTAQPNRDRAAASWHPNPRP